MLEKAHRDPVGLCGIYCAACPLYRVGIDQDIKKAQQFFSTRGRKVSDSDVCYGCASDVVVGFCKDCEVRECVLRKLGVNYCFECPDAPCSKLLELQERASDLFDLLGNINRLKEVGVKAWLAEREVEWSCHNCGASIDWYARICPECGTGEAKT